MVGRRLGDVSREGALVNESDKALLDRAFSPTPAGKRTFETGATRDSDEGKLDFEGALSPAVVWAFAEYMERHTVMADGSRRPSDNWQKGIPLDAFMKSLLRHVVDLWMIHRGHTPIRPEDGHEVTLDDSLGAIMFNAQGYWHETLKAAEK